MKKTYVEGTTTNSAMGLFNSIPCSEDRQPIDSLNKAIMYNGKHVTRSCQSDCDAEAGRQAPRDAFICFAQPRKYYTQWMRTIRCPCCLEDYKTTVMEPWIIPCGHSFCLRCIQRRTKQGIVKCPECSRRHYADRRAKNFALIEEVQRLENLGKFSELTTKQQCSKCTLSVPLSASSLCSTCSDKLKAEGKEEDVEALHKLCESFQMININAESCLDELGSLNEGVRMIKKELTKKVYKTYRTFPIKVTDCTMSLVADIDNIGLPCFMELDAQLQKANEECEAFLKSFASDRR